MGIEQDPHYVRPEEDNIVHIPYYQLSPRALASVIEEYVTRDGTDYGEREVPLGEKVQRVHRQLIAGKAFILFVKETNTCTIVSQDDPRIKGLIFPVREKPVPKSGG